MKQVILTRKHKVALTEGDLRDADERVLDDLRRMAIVEKDEPPRLTREGHKLRDELRRALFTRETQVG